MPSPRSSRAPQRSPKRSHGSRPTRISARTGRIASRVRARSPERLRRRSPPGRAPTCDSSNAVTMNRGLAALAFGNFVIGTGTLIVPGLLPYLAGSLGVSLPVAEHLITAFAVTICVAAPLLAGATSRYDRRALLVAMQLILLFGHLGAALVSSFVPMLGVRIVTAIGAALFTAQAAATAALLVPPQERGRAIAFVFLGWSVSGVLGLPLGSYIGATFGWRAGFGLVAALAAIGAAAVWSAVPGGLKVRPVDGAMWRAILGNASLLSVVAVTALMAAASFALFAYFVPAAHAFIDASPHEVSLLYATLGVTAIVGNTLAARFMDRAGAGRVVVWGLAAVLAGHLLWPWSAGHPALLAPAYAPASIALNSSATYLGQAIGTAIAGVIIANVSGAAAYASLALLSVPLLIAAIGVSLLVSLRARVAGASA